MPAHTLLIRWTAHEDSAGVRLRWAVHAPDDAPVFNDSVDLDATLGEYVIEIADPVPLGHAVTVELTPWEEFAAGSVGGESGATISRVVYRGGSSAVSPSVDDPALDMACRVLFNDDGELLFDDEHCLLLTDQE